MGGAEAWAPSSIFWNLVPGLLYPHSLSALSHLFSVVHSKTTPVGTSQLKNPQELHGREQVQPWKMQAKLRLMRVGAASFCSPRFRAGNKGWLYALNSSWFLLTAVPWAHLAFLFSKWRN
jgi:hypothetical protein